MTATLTRETVHRDLLKDCLSGPLTEADALLWMVLLHTHQIRLQPDAIAGGNGGILTFAAITQRHAAEILASLWADLKRDSGERSRYAYWYCRYNKETPFEVLSHVPDTLLPRLVELRAMLAHDSRVAAVEPED
jgi:hypothetical protein